jgi:hypothetical protein
MSGGALIYVVGAPGSGKSTLMAALTAGCTRHPVDQPVPHDVLTAGDRQPLGAELGRRRTTFSGTDALAMSVSPAAKAWVATHPYGLVLAEGDRLAHMGFLTAAADAGYRVTLVYLQADPDLVDARCAARGSTQDPTWRAGRATKAHRLGASASEAGYRVLLLDAAAPTAENEQGLRALLPVINALPEGTP